MPGPRRFAPPLTVVLAALSLLAACVPQHRVAVPNARLSVGAESFADDGPFRITFAGPKGATAAPREVTITFSRAVHPLGLLDDARASAPPPATVVRAHDDTAVAGTWRWFGERTAVFWPTGGFHPATEYRVSIAAGARALDGSTLAEASTFSFTSARPSLTTASYAYDEEKDRHTVTLDFDQAIAGSEVTRAVHIEGRGAKGQRPIGYHIAAGSDDTRFELEVDRSIATLDDVTVVAAASLTGLEGPLESGREVRRRVEEVGPLRAEIVCPGTDEVEPPDGPIVPRRVTRCAAGNGGIELRLSKDVATKELARRLIVSPPAPLKIDVDQQGTSTRWLSLSNLMSFEPGRKYRFVLQVGLRAVDKQALAADQILDVEMSDLPSSLTWRDIGKVAVVESSRPAVSLALWGTNVSAFDAVQAPLDEQRLLDVLLGDATSAAQVRAIPGSAALRVDVKAAKNATAAAAFDLPATLRGPGKTGSFAIATSAIASGLADDVRVLEVTDLGITADWSPHGGLVWVTRLSSGAPVAGASIALRRAWKASAPGDHVVTSDAYVTRTDKDGIATIPSQVAATFLDDEREQRAAILVASYGDDRAHARLPALDPHLAHALGYAFTERRLYRPGETAFVKAVFRAPTPQGLVSLTGRPATIEAVDEEDGVLFATTTTLDAFGSCSAEVPIPRTAKLGFVEVRARIGTAPLRRPEARRHRWQWDEVAWPARARFVVDEFHTVDFKVEVASDRPAYLRGDTARITARGSYLSGAPMHDVAAPIAISRTPTSFTPPGLEAFVTDAHALGRSERPSDHDVPFSTAEPKLGPSGAVTVPIALDFPQQDGPDSIRVLAAIADVSGAFEAGDSTTFVVHPGDLYLGVREASGGPIFPGRKVHVELVAAGLDGTRRPDVPVRVEVLRRDESGLHEPTRMQAGCDLRTTREVVTCELTAPSPGSYYLHATALDSRGRPVGAAASFYVQSVTPPPLPPAAPPPAKPAPPPPPLDPVLPFDDACRAPPRKGFEDQALSILADMDGSRYTLSVGEHAHLCLRGTGPTLLTVEREGVLHHELRHLDRIGTLVDLPITAAFHPNVRIALHGVAGRTLPFPDPKHPRNDAGHPTSSGTSFDLRVDAPATKLLVSIETEREYQPGAEIVARVRVHDAFQRPAQAQVTFWAVDEAIVQLASFRTPDLHEVFGQERGDDVATLDTRDLLFWEHIGMHVTQSPSLREGAASVGARTHVTRGLFRPTAFFVPNLVTGPDGVATVKVKLPDNLTTWNLYASAMTSGEAFGAAESFFRTNKLLMVRPQLPRFVRAGDHIEATVMVDSMAKEPLDVKVSMRATGGLAGASAVSETAIALPADGHVPVRFPLDARSIGKGTITFRVEAPRAKLADEVIVEEDITAASTLETVVISGETSTRADEPLGDLSRARPDAGGLDFRLATTPLIGLAESLEGLVEYPYGCTEQLTSRLVPLVRLRGLARELAVALPRDLDGAVRSSIASLLTHQRSDGGFGFWPGSKVSEPWLTVASLNALYASRSAGYFVPEEPMSRAAKYLESAKGLDAGERALLEDLFASDGRPREKELRTLAALAESEAMPYFGRALVAHALAKVDRPLALRVLASVASHARVTGATAMVADERATSARASLSSDARTTAMVLRAFVALDPRDALVTKLVRGLLSMRQRGRWTTTQASAWALLALDDARLLYAGGSAATSAQVWLDGSELAKASFSGAGARGSQLTGSVPMTRLVASAGGTLSFTAEGGPLFFEGALRYARRELPQTPLEHGIHVAKTMHVLRRNADPTVTTDFRVGDYVEVDVLLASPVQRDLVVLDDPLPAGFEAVNQTFANRDAAMIRPDASNAVTHRELRDDRVVTFFDALPAGEHHTSYVLRVMSGGRFVTPPAKAECMYAPDVFGRTGASVVLARQ